MTCLLMQESLPQAEELCIDITALQSWVRHMILTCKPGTKKRAQLARIFFSLPSFPSLPICNRTPTWKRTGQSFTKS